MATNFFCLTTSTGTDECWECGGSATLGGSQDAVTETGRPNARYCSYDCLESYKERVQAERRRRDRRCVVCDEPEGLCCTEFQDVDGSMTQWPHAYEPRCAG